MEANTIVVKEDRAVIEKFRGWYKEKVIDTGLSAKVEEGIVGSTELKKKVVVVAGVVATVVLAFVPHDGQIGELCAALATPMLPKLVELESKITNTVIINEKRWLESFFMKADGSSEMVDVPKLNLKEIESDISKILPDIKNFLKSTESKKESTVKSGVPVTDSQTDIPTASVVEAQVEQFSGRSR